MELKLALLLKRMYLFVLLQLADPRVDRSK